MSPDVVRDIRRRLIEVGGRTSQDLGLGRIFGQILVYLYLQEGECCLDLIGQELGLSKAAISVAIRQLESLGMVKRVWKQGDRKKYYRTVDGIGEALKEGLLTFVRQKMQTAGSELDHVNTLLEKAVIDRNATPDTIFLHGRVKRAKQLRDLISKVLGSPVIDFFAKS